MFPVNSQWAVAKAFDEFADRCEIAHVQIVQKTNGDGVDYKAWLYEVAETMDQKVVMLHLEPLHVTADSLSESRLLNPLRAHCLTTINGTTARSLRLVLADSD
jgi:hypothetical protein